MSWTMILSSVHASIPMLNAEQKCRFQHGAGVRLHLGFCEQEETSGFSLSL